MPINTKFELNKKRNFINNKKVNIIAKIKTITAKENTILNAISNHINILIYKSIKNLSLIY